MHCTKNFTYEHRVRLFHNPPRHEGHLETIHFLPLKNETLKEIDLLIPFRELIAVHSDNLT